ncbi:hypothetical protein FJY71_05610 [candidate division WOR-3 bacterium]|nr:hypothetical protein [candidate division WOR-3 bacterium]
MRLGLLLAAVLLLPPAVQGANICVLNYDVLDRFWDPVRQESVDCSYWVEQMLADQGHSVEAFDEVLPPDISGYDAVFLLMGWYRC